MIETATEIVQTLTSVDVTIGAGLVMLLVVLIMCIPEPYKMVYSSSAFKEMRRSRDEWKARWEEERD